MPRAERLPPHSSEAEQAVLGSVLLDRDVIALVSPLVRPSDFYLGENGEIFAAMTALYEAQTPVDYLTLTHELERRGSLGRAGGLAHLSGLLGAVPTPIHAEHYARIVARCALMRRLVSVGGQIASLGYRDETEPEAAITACERLLAEALGPESQPDFVRLSELLGPYGDELVALGAGEAQEAVVASGFLDLDRRLGGGFGRSNLVVLAARPGMGKTSLALNVAARAAERGARIAVFSLEMAARELVGRLLSAQSGITLGRLRQKNNGDLTKAESARLGSAFGRLAEAEIYLDETPALTVSGLCSRARRLAARSPLDLVVVDHLQLLTAPKRDQNRVQEMAEISRSLKALARELRCTVLALSQLNRAVEGRTGKVPTLADLRESGAIEQDSDVVLFIYRDEYYNPQTARPGVADVYVAKHRSGQTGMFSLLFEDSLTRFLDLANLERSA